jgi:peptide deformylase
MEELKMVREIVKDEEFLTKKSEPFDFDKDLGIVDDLLDTAKSFGLRCAGLAAVQIGYHKRALVVRLNENTVWPMIDPVIFSKSEPYTSVEGCLSLDGEREVKRYRRIKVCYKTPSYKSVIKEFNGYLAKVIQHEVDHLNGILI